MRLLDAPPAGPGYSILRIDSESGAVSWDLIWEIGELVCGKTPRRKDDSEITILKNNGLSVQFAGVGAAVMQRAKNTGSAASSRYIGSSRLIAPAADPSPTCRRVIRQRSSSAGICIHAGKKA